MTRSELPYVSGALIALAVALVAFYVVVHLANRRGFVLEPNRQDYRHPEGREQFAAKERAKQARDERVLVRWCPPAAGLALVVAVVLLVA